MTPAQQQWHWQEGNKYALECMKALLWLNGGGAIALLTFFGNRGKMLTSASTDAIGSALTGFSIGTVGSVMNSPSPTSHNCITAILASQIRLRAGTTALMSACWPL